MDPPLIWTTIRVVALALGLWPCHDATIPWALVGRALVGPPGPLCAGPLWAPLGPHGPGPNGLRGLYMGKTLIRTGDSKGKTMKRQMGANKK